MGWGEWKKTNDWNQGKGAIHTSFTSSRVHEESNNGSGEREGGSALRKCLVYQGEEGGGGRETTADIVFAPLTTVGSRPRADQWQWQPTQVQQAIPPPTSLPHPYFSSPPRGWQAISHRCRPEQTASERFGRQTDRPTSLGDSHWFRARADLFFSTAQELSSPLGFPLLKSRASRPN